MYTLQHQAPASIVGGGGGGVAPTQTHDQSYMSLRCANQSQQRPVAEKHFLKWYLLASLESLESKDFCLPSPSPSTAMPSREVGLPLSLGPAAGLLTVLIPENFRVPPSCPRPFPASCAASLGLDAAALGEGPCADATTCDP